jgi:hypothetical protein
MLAQPPDQKKNKWALQSFCRFVTRTKLAVSTAAAGSVVGFMELLERLSTLSNTALSYREPPRPASADLVSIQWLHTGPSFTRGNFPRSVHPPPPRTPATNQPLETLTARTARPSRDSRL